MLSYLNKGIWVIRHVFIILSHATSDISIIKSSIFTGQEGLLTSTCNSSSQSITIDNRKEVLGPVHSRYTIQLMCLICGIAMSHAITFVQVRKFSNNFFSNKSSLNPLSKEIEKRGDSDW